MKHILFLILFFPIIVMSQGFDASSNKKDSEISKSATGNSISPFTTSLSKPSILEGVINSSEYKVGPGDIFGLSISSSTPFSIEVIVTPEGSILIPTVGNINIAGLTLEQSKQKIANSVKNKYSMSEVNFVLMVPRIFKVTVIGEVEFPALYNAQATDRVGVIIAHANGEKEYVGLNPVNKKTNGSTRNIKVIHRSGTEIFIDLELYKSTRNTKYNPYLQDGDVIIIPKKQIGKNYLAIYGEVNFQGTYEYLESDNLKNLILIAGDVSSLADLKNVEVTRWNNQTQKDEIIKLDLQSNPENFGFVLKRGDRVNIFSIISTNFNYTVRVDGEVNNPGIYPITKEATYLSEIINRAGGFTKFASMNSSKIARRLVTHSELEVEKLEGIRGNLAPEDIEYFNTETALRINREIVVVDFNDIFKENNKSADVLLKSGDVISIPSIQKNIYIYGQVAKPGYIPLLSSNKVDDYINFAGGFLENAKSGDIKIIKSSTKEWVDPSETTIEDGDYIFVPKEPYRAPRYYFETFRDIAALTTSLATLYLMVIQIGK